MLTLMLLLALQRPPLGVFFDYLRGAIPSFQNFLAEEAQATLQRGKSQQLHREPISDTLRRGNKIRTVRLLHRHYPRIDQRIQALKDSIIHRLTFSNISAEVELLKR
jgi:hypothetical protein